MRRAAKIDIMQPMIVEALRQVGSTVQVLSAVGQGCPDILCGWHGRNVLMELKDEKGELTPDQLVWHKKWTGQKDIVRSITDAIEVLNNAVK